jgi:hypothetical protein
MEEHDVVYTAINHGELMLQTLDVPFEQALDLLNVLRSLRRHAGGQDHAGEAERQR